MNNAFLSPPKNCIGIWGKCGIFLIQKMRNKKLSQFCTQCQIWGVESQN